MIRRLFACVLLLAGIFFLSPADAFWQSRDSNYDINIAATGPYVGPGDTGAAGAAYAYWGIRAYTNATLGNKLVNVCNAGDATCADLSSNATSGLITYPSTIGGNACSVTISSGSYVSATGATVLTTAASPGGLASGQPLALTGLTGTGSFVNLGYVAQTATSGTTGTTINFTAVTGLGTLTITGGTVSVCTVKTFYDLTAGSNCTGVCDAAQATIASRLVLAVSCLGSNPCVMGQHIGTGYVTAGNMTLASPWSAGHASFPSSNNQNFAALRGANGGSYDSVVTSVLYYEGIVSGANKYSTAGISNNAWSVGMTTVGSTGYILYTDGSSNGSNTATSNFQSAGVVHVWGDQFSQPWNGKGFEVGLWNSQLSGTLAAAWSSNVHSFWGF